MEGLQRRAKTPSPPPVTTLAPRLIPLLCPMPPNPCPSHRLSLVSLIPPSPRFPVSPRFPGVRRDYALSFRSGGGVIDPVDEAGATLKCGEGENGKKPRKYPHSAARRPWVGGRQAVFPLRNGCACSVF